MLFHPRASIRAEVRKRKRTFSTELSPEEAQMAALTPEQRAAYWSKTSRLMWTIMILWFVFSFGVHLFAVQLNTIKFLGFPLGFYMAAQGSLIAFVVLCFWNSSAQNKIDAEFGVRED
jgi:putative solute:sodium symporter small subunit